MNPKFLTPVNDKLYDITNGLRQRKMTFAETREWSEAIAITQKHLNDLERMVLTSKYPGEEEESNEISDGATRESNAEHTVEEHADQDHNETASRDSAEHSDA